MTDRPEITKENVDYYVDKYSDLWLPAKDVDKILPINYQAVHLWARRGLVRSEQIPKSERVHRGPDLRYNVADCVIARLAIKRSKKFRMKTVDGVRHGCCTKCEKWQPAEGDEDQFYDDSRNGGKYPTCKTCHNHRPMTDRQKRDAARRQARIYKTNRESAEIARTWKGVEAVDSQTVLNIVRARYPEETSSEICRLANVHIDMFRKIRKNADLGKPTRIAPVDKLMTGLDLAAELREIINKSGAKAPSWHHTFPYCQNCQSVVRPHRLRGLCSSCYANRKVPGFMPPPDNRWSMKHARCVTCETTQTPHRAKGECRKCADKRRPNRYKR